MLMRRAAFLLGLVLAAAGCGQEFKLPPTPPPEPLPDAGRYHYEKSWGLNAPGDVAIRGSYLYVITQNRGASADSVKGQIEVFLTNRPDPTPPPPGFILPFTGLKDPTHICVVKGDSTYIIVSDRDEVARIDTTNVVDHVDSTEVGGNVVYDTTFVTQTVTTRRWAIRRFHFTGGAPLLSFGLPGEWAEVNGLAADENLNVYVTDAVRDVVAKYDRRGRFLATLSSRGTGDGYINQARGLDWNGADLIVGDTGQDRVVFLDPDRVEWATRRPVGTVTGPYSPRRPEDVAGDRSRSFLYVADTGRDRVLKYKLTGEFVDSVYSARMSIPRLIEPILAPRFVAVEDPLVFVSDPAHDRLVAFALADSF
jgi:hypothetical protein